MLIEVTNEKAFAELLNGNEKVYVFDEASCQIQSLGNLLANMRLLADISTEEPQTINSTPSKEETLEEENAEEEMSYEKNKSKWEKLDYGKITALRRARWAVTKIAEEMKCPPYVIYNHFRKNGDPIYETNGKMAGEKE